MRRMWTLVSVMFAATVCPEGSVLKARTTPEAREEWCDRAGSRHGPRRAFYPDGHAWFEGEYTNGKRSGAWVFWYVSGKLMAQATYVDDKADGALTRWHENGNKALEGVCRAGVEVGRWQRFWPNGKEEVAATFVNGKAAEAAQYFSRRGVLVDRQHWLNEKAPGAVPGSDRYLRLELENQLDSLFAECRN